MPDSDKSENERKTTPSFGRVLQSTLAGAIGVQSNKNREKDFENGNIWVFIVSGIVFTVLFIFAVTSVVRLALSGA